MCRSQVTTRPLAVLFTVIGVLLGGCETTSGREMTWQALHAVDVAQTLNAAPDPCYREASWMTRRIIGEQPSDAEVLAWGAATALAHMWISSFLERREAPQWIKSAWQLGSIGQTGFAVVNNHRIGVRPWGSNEGHDGCRV